MKILYCHDNVYLKSPDGAVFSPGQFPYEYWTVFLEAFGELTVAGRGRGLGHDESREALNVSSGRGVSFLLFPNINTLSGRLRYLKTVEKSLETAVAEADGLIIRAVSDIGWLAYKQARRMGKPVAMEMAACAWDSTWHHGNALGKIYAPVRYIRDKTIARHADFVLYVTQRFLQDRYPADAETVSISNVRVDMTDDSMIERRLARIKQTFDMGPCIIGLIGNLDNKIKGIGDALQALALLEKRRPGRAIFRHLGPGRNEKFRELAAKLGIADIVHFDGMLKSGSQVLDWLDGIDLYIQPSYQEGVPRAVIEAMSRGCPAIGSTAGGIPELLPESWMHRPGNAAELAARMEAMISSPSNMLEAASRNFLHARNYANETLAQKRRDFWRQYALFIQERVPPAEALRTAA